MLAKPFDDGVGERYYSLLSVVTYHGTIFNDHITGAVIDDICVRPSHLWDNRSCTNMEKVITWLLLHSMAVDCIKAFIKLSSLY